MTFYDDFVQFQMLSGGPRRLRCSQVGVEWPPPEEITWLGFTWTRIRFSAITDEQRKEMTHVCRGAEYGIKDAP